MLFPVTWASVSVARVPELIPPPSPLAPALAPVPSPSANIVLALTLERRSVTRWSDQIPPPWTWAENPPWAPSLDPVTFVPVRWTVPAHTPPPSTLANPESACPERVVPAIVDRIMRTVSPLIAPPKTVASPEGECALPWFPVNVLPLTVVTVGTLWEGF